ncbi:septum formation family protein [Gulosibacter sp. ACHW.36C]|uniref:Septum formation family protein n=1 Tax=Gulosibacter sediminis TaxID=1729695 RepID=A0ABY4MYY9_9MICO|nr:septum formation family protein [Gulosibacter sediminis]UQN15229.1 septum formation family protein [Gulosibacter sediminis]
MSTKKLRIPGVLAAVAIAGLVLTGCQSGNERIEDRSNTEAEAEQDTTEETTDIEETTAPEESDEEEFQAPEEQSVFDITVGDCVTQPEEESSEYQSLEVVPCTQAHEYEVFYEFNVEDLDEFDQTAIEDEILDQCYGQPFEDFIGTAYDQSTLGVQYLMPTQGSWDSGDRLVSCMVYEADDTNETTQSLEGSRL